MSKKHERQRHIALARETGSWQSWAVDMWFTNGYMALLLDEPFSGPHMALEFGCMCSDRRAHADTLDRSCVFVDRYERDPKIGGALSSMLAASLTVKGSAYAVIDRGTEVETDDGLVLYRARVEGEDDPRAWFGVQTRYADAIERHAHPDRWAILQRPSTPEIPVPPIVFALRGQQGVGIIMPVTCPGSGLELAPSEALA